jgi:hypothetical protein
LDNADTAFGFRATTDVDLELQAQMRRSMSLLDREVDKVLKRAGERRAKAREGGGVLSRKAGGRATWSGNEKQRRRERVEWRNREEAVGVLVVDGVLVEE